MKIKFRRFCEAFTQSRDGSVSVSLKAVATVCIAWIIVITYVAQEQLPKNVISLPAQEEVKYTVVNLAPQGWAFFTKSPRDPEIIPFKKAPGDWRPLALTPHASPRNAFGLNRESRAQGVEIAMLLSAAKKDDWRECTDDRQHCLKSFGTPARHVENRSPDPILCGTVGLLQERPTPWAWRDLMPEAHSPERVMVLEVTC
ncbi:MULTISPECIES: SdpA family antimicrobial peptide system protein [Streptomyces]|uniref:SdpA family antimicrobial peptide system protein n=1 Tax=Streptomyces fuscus TaxID=3048495 RepID=A0ABT7ISI4_9ACTN|nr:MULTISPECIES: SdpA family antimicrobial peptide system protein [Streptomyces]MCM1974409.1 SdpA family antimicrobial peptide system protein [Streptomyces sp. G1]MDL2075547.1 SdpA family antimicrobial peptide system protein [Streptomyces fuscus]SBT94528.1 antimicrobial peptide system protein, SdpA family [Streptomyces sp. DI166]